MTNVTPSEPGTTPSLGTASLLAINVNIVALIISIFLTVVGVKLTSFLPEKYYFSFSQFVDSDKATPFLIAAPGHVADEKLCDVFASDKRLKPSACKTDVPPPGEEGENEGSTEIEQKYASEDIRRAASGSFLENMFGYGIRICIPLLVGFVVTRYVGPEGVLAASFGAAMAALLLCWPVIVLWDKVVSEGFQKLYGQFLLLYILNTITFFYMARLGSIFGLQLGPGPLQTISFSKIIELSLSKIIETSIIAIIGGVGAKYVEHLILTS